MSTPSDYEYQKYREKMLGYGRILERELEKVKREKDGCSCKSPKLVVGFIIGQAIAIVLLSIALEMSK